MSDPVEAKLTSWREYYAARRTGLVGALEVPDEMIASAGAELANLHDRREQYAFTLGVLESVVERIAECHHCGEDRCDICFQLRMGLAGIVALDGVKDEAARTADLPT